MFWASLSSVMFLYTYSCDCITVFIADGKNGGFLKCGQIIHSPAEIRQWFTMCSRPVCFCFVPLCREGDAKIAGFSNLCLFLLVHIWPIYILVFPSMFWCNWNVAERGSSGWWCLDSGIGSVCYYLLFFCREEGLVVIHPWESKQTFWWTLFLWQLLQL